MATKTWYPTSDSAVQLDCTAATHYTEVDDDPNDGATTRVYHIGAGYGTDIFGHTADDVPAGATSISITLYAYCAKSGGAGANPSLVLLLRIGGTDYLGSTQTMTSTSYTEFTETWATNPATSSAWTVSEINSVLLGVRPYGVAGPPAPTTGNCSAIKAVVTYTPAAAATAIPKIFGPY